MEYRRLGRTGLNVSRLCLGTMNFGTQTDERESFAIMDRALDHGINFFDTANVYGGKLGEGITEGIIGRWLAQGGGRRDKVIIATKVFGRMGEGVNDRRLSAYHIRKACEESLKRLQTDVIDLYQMHHIDRDTPWEEIWQAFELLVQQGKAIYIGSSNFAGWQIVQAQAAAERRNFLGLVCEQSLYNLSERMIELEVIPACRAMGLAMIPWSPLAGGLLGGVLDQQKTGRRNSQRLIETVERSRGQIEAFESLCSEVQQRPADVALAWLLKNPDITAPIIGPRTLEQLNQAVDALEVHLSEETWSQIEQIWPGPGGEAPEAYAW